MVSVHVGELGESLRQLVRLGLGETVVGGVEVVVGGVEVVVNGVGVGAVLNGNKVVVGGGEVCDAWSLLLVVGPRRSLSSGTEARDVPGDRGHGDLSQDV